MRGVECVGRNDDFFFGFGRFFFVEIGVVKGVGFVEVFVFYVFYFCSFGFGIGGVEIDFGDKGVCLYGEGMVVCNGFEDEFLDCGLFI